MSNDTYLTTEQAAEYLKLSVHTLNSYRSRKYDAHRCPPFRKVGGRILYPKAEVDAWVEKQEGLKVCG